MIAIDVKTYDLIFYRKSDGQMFKAKRVCPGRYKILLSEDPIETLELSEFEARRDYRKCREAAKRKRRLFKRTRESA